jgi:phosphatidylglycerophosphate synthase
MSGKFETHKLKKGEEARKISSSIENPIDNVMISTSDALSPYFKKLNYTPNGITTISLVLALASLHHLYNHDVNHFGVYFILSYLFDCMDGYYARKYSMVTEGGDKYDHYKDLIVVIGLIYVLYDRYCILDHMVLLLVLGAMAVLGMMTVGCQERLTKKEHSSNNLAVFDPITPCKETCMSSQKYLRFFGSGTLVVALIAAVYYLDSFDSNESSTNTNNPVEYNGDNAITIADVLDISKPFNGLGRTSFRF